MRRKSEAEEFNIEPSNRKRQRVNYREEKVINHSYDYDAGSDEGDDENSNVSIDFEQDRHSQKHNKHHQISSHSSQMRKKPDSQL
jgi:hypothetical protein